MQAPSNIGGHSDDDAGPGAHDDPGWADLLVDVANQSTETSSVLARQLALDPDRLARRCFVGRVGDVDRANRQARDHAEPGEDAHHVPELAHHMASLQETRTCTS